MVHEVNENEFDEAVKSGLVLVDFYADWCGPCRMISENLKSAAAIKKDVKFIKINVDTATELARQYGIMSIPKLILFKDGNKINEVNGYLETEEIINFLEKN